MTDDNTPIDESQFDERPDDEGGLRPESSNIPSDVIDAAVVPPDGIVFRIPAAGDIVDQTNSHIRFYIPQNETTSHPVSIWYHRGNSKEYVKNKVSYRAFVDHDVYWNIPANGAGEYESIWWYNGKLQSKQSFVKFYASNLPVITDLGATRVDEIAGTGGDGSRMLVVQQSTGTPFSSSFSGSNGSWRIRLFSTLPAGKYQIGIGQYADGYTTRYSVNREFIYYKAPVVVTPASGGSYDTNLVIKGSGGVPGEVIIVMTPGGAVTHGEATVKADGTWETPFINQLHYPAGGNVTITAAHKRATGRLGSWSLSRTFVLLTTPAITAPAQNSIQDKTFTLVGDGGVPGLTLEVYIDATTTKVGSTYVLATGSWSCSVTTNVGPVALIAAQKKDNTYSARSTPRSFKIRPAPPSNVSAVVTSPTVVFKGGGHTSATVSIRGDGFMATPPSVTVIGDSWTTTAAKMLPRSTPYTCYVLQSVADGGGGRIDSQEVSLTVAVLTPTPTGTTYTLNSNNVPTLRGRTPVWEGHRTVIEVNLNGRWTEVVVQPDGSWVATGSVLPPGSHTPQVRLGVNQTYSSFETLPPIVVRPLAPSDIVVTPNGFSPNIAGKCWPSATLSLKYSDRDVFHTINGDMNGNWSFRRDIAFPPGNHSFTVTQTSGGQTSPARSMPFNVPTPALTITKPNAGEEVTLRPTITIANAYIGAVIKIYDATAAGKVLGQRTVGDDWDGFVTLTGEFQTEGEQSFYVLQDYKGQESARSATVRVTARLPKPLVQVPQVKVERHAEYSGSGWPNSTITLTRVGVPGWEVKDVPVDAEGIWKVQITVPEVGPQTLAITQKYNAFSRDGDDTIFTVVPNLPFLETPAQGERLTLRPMFSGFGYPGDTVSVVKNNEAAVILGTALVSDKGTWFVRSDIDLPVGLDYQFSVQQGRDTHLSNWFPFRTFHVLNPGPSVDEPVSGDWMGICPWVCGRDEPGAKVTVASVFDAQEVLAKVTTVDGSGHWRVQLDTPLLIGPNWVQARADRGAAKGVSDWARSGRFMVEKMEDNFDPPTVSVPPRKGQVGLRPLLQGSGLPGALISIHLLGDEDVVAAQAWVDREGRWTARFNNPLPVIDGLTHYTVNQLRDGVRSVYLARTFKVVQLQPDFAAPILLSPEAGDEVDPQFWIEGMAFPGAEVEVYRNGASVIATTQANAEGQWKVCITPTLTLQNLEFRAVQWLDQQQSVWSPLISVRVKQTLSPPLLDSPADGTQVGPMTKICGRGYPGATVTLLKSGDPNTSWGSALVNALGYWQIWTEPLPLGTFRFGGKQEMSGKPRSPWMKEFVVHVVNAG